MKRSKIDPIKTRFGRITPILSLLLLTGFLLACPRTAEAQFTWTGSVNDLWSNPGNWESGGGPGVPNSAAATATISAVLNNPVVISGINPTVATLTLSNSGNGLTIDTGQDLFMDGIGGSTISNAGGIVLNGGGGANAILLTDSTNVTLQGGGTVTLSTASGGGNAIIQQEISGTTLTNVNNTIQGNGIIGDGGLTLDNQSGGTVNANVSGGTLTLNGSGGATNAGLFEATGGGTLSISGITVNNSGGNITANSGSTVQLVGADIQGGTLNNNGGTLGTASGNSAFLDGSTGAGAVTINGTYTGAGGSDTFLLGTITNQGNIQLNGGGGANAILLTDSTNVTLQGGGTVTLSTASGGGNAIIQQEIGGTTLTNVNNTIQGAGIIGDGGLTLDNQSGGTVNANVSGGTLTLNGSGGATNAGLLEASNGGILSISGITVNNSGGNITANSGSTVQLVGNTVIQGGTLNNNGGTLGTASGNSAFLDGSTGAGAVTINGTYTGAGGSDTFLLGTITNQGNIQLNGGGGANAILLTDSTNVTLQGGGTVTLSTASGGGNAIIQQEIGGTTLTNVNNTIQGAGIIGNGGLSLLNEAGGTILANAPGQTLTLNGSGTTTNNGTFQADSGSTLTVSNLTNLSGTTLTGGTYNVFSGTMQLPGNVNTNAATILLDGSTGTPSLLNGSGTNALVNFATNAAAGNFTIQNGVSQTSSASSDFTNAGRMTVGATSTFTVGGSHDFQNTGLLEGTGTVVAGTLFNSGTVHPGASPGTLTVTGNYNQSASGTLDIQIGGGAPGSGYSVLSISGSALLGGTLDLSLINGFTPFNGETFTILTSAGILNNSEFATVNGLHEGNVTFTVVYQPGDVVLDATVGTSAVPEPASLVMFAIGIAGMGVYVARCRGKAARA